MLSINEKNIVVFDCETTGLNEKNDLIIELGAVKIYNNKKIDTYHQLFNPKMPLQEKITQLTGITDEMLKDKPTLEERFHEFLDFIGEDSILVAHNLPFDYNFIHYTAKRMNKEIKNKGICTLLLARKLFPQKSIKEYKNNLKGEPMPKSHKLSDLSSFLNIPLVNAHRADEDAGATSKIFYRLLQVTLKKDISLFFDMIQEKEEILKEKEESQKRYMEAPASEEQIKFIQSLISQVGQCTLLKSVEYLKKSEASVVISALKEYQKTGLLTENELISR